MKQSKARQCEARQGQTNSEAKQHSEANQSETKPNKATCRAKQARQHRTKPNNCDPMDLWCIVLEGKPPWERVLAEFRGSASLSLAEFLLKYSGMKPFAAENKTFLDARQMAELNKTIFDCKDGESFAVVKSKWSVAMSNVKEVSAASMNICAEIRSHLTVLKRHQDREKEAVKRRRIEDELKVVKQSTQAAVDNIKKRQAAVRTQKAIFAMISSPKVQDIPAVLAIEAETH